MADPIELARSISRFKKENFLKDKSEDEFRDEVIRPLFYRLGYGDGQDLCGPMEEGKDAIFTETNRLNVTELIAVQTKRGNLNLASRAQQNLLNAVTQLQTALKTSISLINPKGKRLPDKVILCASGKINQRARTHIVSEIHDTNLQFLDSDNLIPLIDEHFPELWLNIDANILPYFRAVKDFVEGSIRTTGPSGQEGDTIFTGAAADDSFLSLTLYRHYQQIHKRRGKITRDLAFEELDLEKLPARDQKKVLVLGEAGAGKSTALKRLAYQLVRRGITDKDKYLVPIYLRAPDIADNCTTDLLSYCDVSTRELAKSKTPCFTRDDLSKGHVYVLIDGLDEVPSPEGREKVLSLAEEFSNLYPEVSFYVTSRPNEDIFRHRSLAEFLEYRISPISWKQAARLYRKVRKQRSLPESESKELLRRVEQIHGIELNPLMVTVFAVTSDFDRKDIPANITELFKKFTEWMLGRWDDGKGLSQQYHAPLKDFILQKIAFRMHASRNTQISESTFRNYCSDLLRERGHTADIEQLLDELLTRSGLLRNVGDMVEFRHHLIQEFFAGRGIETEEFILEHIAEDWWKRAIVFYFGENPSQLEKLRSTKNNIKQSLSGPELTGAATTIGLSLQACYLSPIADKLELWKWVNLAIGRSRKSTSQLFSHNGQYPLIGFLHFYLETRDAVALTNLVEYQDEIESWIESAAPQDGDLTEFTRFLYIVSLIETGKFEAAKSVLDKLDITDSECLLAIHMGAYLWLTLRDITPSQKRAAQEICDYLKPKITGQIRQVVDEFGSQLLEMRRGEVSKIDDVRDSESGSDKTPATDRAGSTATSDADDPST